MNKPAIFLDRDGVINIDKGYVYKISDFEWIQDSKKAIKYMKEKNFYVFVVTNQSGITRGFYNERDVDLLHSYINRELKKIDTQIDDFFYSPYHPEISNIKYDNMQHLRKPNTGMLELAQKKWDFDKKNTLMIGDSKSDIECAKNFGIKGLLFKNGSLLEFIKNYLT
tara:strand:- start:1687 stop:2187 length:501 start_codon:yes stop_codon:yes gene_type:complete